MLIIKADTYEECLNGLEKAKRFTSKSVYVLTGHIGLKHIIDGGKPKTKEAKVFLKKFRKIANSRYLYRDDYIDNCLSKFTDDEIKAADSICWYDTFVQLYCCNDNCLCKNN